MKHRLHDMFGDKVQYKVVDEPVSLPDAKALAGMTHAPHRVRGRQNLPDIFLRR